MGKWYRPFANGAVGAGAAEGCQWCAVGLVAAQREIADKGGPNMVAEQTTLVDAQVNGGHVGTGTFSALLAEYRRRARWTRNALAHEVGVDPSYLTRIERGDREPPRAHIVVALARTLRLTGFEQSRLLVAAGHRPAGEWDAAHQAVSNVLGNCQLAPQARAAFREVVCTLAAHWGRA